MQLFFEFFQVLLEGLLLINFTFLVFILLDGLGPSIETQFIAPVRNLGLSSACLLRWLRVLLGGSLPVKSLYLFDSDLRLLYNFRLFYRFGLD
jgi:hypothetical protein